jgi:hypothetical protein
MLGLNGLYTALAPNSCEACRRIRYLSCLFMDIRYVTSLLSQLRLREWLCSSWIKVCGESVWYAASAFVTFRKESVITEWKHILGTIWFFQNYCRTIYPMFLRTFFSENDDFVRETKIVPREKKYSESRHCQSLPKFFHHQTVVSITLCCHEQ